MALNKDDRITRAKLDSAANDPDGSPQARISASSDLLKFDISKNQRVTARTERTCRSVVARFAKYSSASLGVQRAVRTAADHLREDLETSLKAQPAGPEEDDAAIPMAHPSPQSTPVDGEQPLIGGLDLLKEQDGTDRTTNWQHRPWQYYDAVHGFRNAPTKTELLATIDVEERLHWKGGSDGRFGLGWKDTDGLFCLADQTEYDAAWSQVVSLYDRLLKDLLGDAPVTLESLEAVELQIRPPYLEFVDGYLERPYLDRVVAQKSPTSVEALILQLTPAGQRKRFIGLIKVRLIGGYDVYGKQKVTVKEQAYAIQ